MFFVCFVAGKVIVIIRITFIMLIIIIISKRRWSSAGASARAVSPVPVRAISAKPAA